MANPTLSAERRANEIPEWDRPEDREEGDDRRVTDRGYLPASAQQFPVMSLQRWTDLCA